MKTSQAAPLMSPGCKTGTKRMLCACKQISEDEVRETINLLPTPSVEDVSYLTGAGTGCTACHCKIERIIDGKSPCGPFSLCDGCGCCMAICGCSAEEAEACHSAKPCERGETGLD